jgi:translation initiation factor IF-2
VFTHGKVRAMLSDMGTPVTEAGPSIPVEVLGLSGVPFAGDELVAVKDEKDAKQVSQHRTQKQRSKELAKTNRMSLDNLFEKMKEGEVKDLNLIIKTDVDGSMEAIERFSRQIVERRSQNQCRPFRFRHHYGIGCVLGRGIQCHYYRASM